MIYLIGIIGFLSSLAQATTFSDRPFEDRVQDAPAVVRGRVGMSYVDWGVGPDGKRRLYTIYELQGDEVFKGEFSDPARILMRELGGEKNGVGMQVSGAAHFERGEDVVVFLGPRNADATHDLRGLMLGRYGVAKDEEGQEYLPDADTPLALHPDARDHAEWAQDGTRRVRKWTLTALRQVISEQAREKRDGSGKGTPSEETGTSPNPALGASTGAKDSGNTAPALQPEEIDPENRDSGKWILWVLGALLVGLGWGFLRRRR